MPEMLGLNDKQRSAAAAEKPYDWRCPGVLSVQSLTTMQVVLSKAAPALAPRLGWIEKIEDAAVPALQKIASEWVAQPAAAFQWRGQFAAVLAVGTQDCTDSPQERWRFAPLDDAPDAARR